MCACDIAAKYPPDASEFKRPGSGKLICTKSGTNDVLFVDRSDAWTRGRDGELTIRPAVAYLP